MAGRQQGGETTEASIARLSSEQHNMESWVSAFEEDFKEFRRDHNQRHAEMSRDISEIKVAVGVLVARVETQPQAPPPPTQPPFQRATTILDLLAQWSGRGSKVVLLLFLLFLLKVISFDIDLGRLNAALDAYAKLSRVSSATPATPAPVAPLAPLIVDRAP